MPHLKLKLLTGVIYLIVLWGHAAEPATGFTVPAPRLTRIGIDLRDVAEPVNRRVFGVCAIMPPYDKALTDLCGAVFDGASVRVWANTRYFRGDQDDMEVCENAWRDMLGLVKGADFAECYAFWPFSHLGKPAHYASEQDNNLEPRHQPTALAAYVRWLNSTPHPSFPRAFRVKNWEMWNEPQFPQSGAWSAEEYARYVIDCSRALRSVQPDIEIGACLHEGDMDWNRRMLGRIAATDIDSIDFVITHPYDFSWMHGRHQMGSYYARVSGSARIRAKLHEKAQLAFRLGHGRWRVAATEWNTHPSGYGPPYNVSTDMAVAVNVAGMFDLFWNEGIDSATFFQLVNRGRGGPTHFALVNRSVNGLRLLPTGEVFSLYGRYFRGNRLIVRSDTPTFPYTDPSGTVDCIVPLVIAHAAYEAERRRLTLLLANRHRDRSTPIEVHVSSFSPVARHVKRILVTAKGPESTEAVHRESDESLLPSGQDPTFRLELPPHSVTALLIEGNIPATEAELFSGRMQFIRDWTVGRVSKPNAGPAHGLDAPLNESTEHPGHRLRASSGGFIDVASLLNVTGESNDIGEGRQALARSWVFSPIRRVVNINVGFDCRGLVFVNGNEVLGARDRPGPPRPDSHRGKAALDAGWNRLDIRVASGSKGMGFWFGIQNTGDLQFTANADKPPSWPRQWRVTANDGADVNAFETFRNAPRPTHPVLELAVHPRRLAYVRWPIAPWPGWHNGFHVRLVLTPAYVRGAGSVRVRPVLSPWDDATLCFTKQPKLGKPVPVEVSVNAKRWVFAGQGIDTMVSRWLADPAHNFGIAVESDVSKYAAFHSDDTPDKAPKLMVESSGH